MKRLLRGRILLACAGLGAGLAALMITTHTGPGITPLPKPSSPQTRNEIREIMITGIANALSDYRFQKGKLPLTLSPLETGICTNYGDKCKQVKLVDLNFLVADGSFLNNISSDPTATAQWNTGFTISQLPDGRIRLRAPLAEKGAQISVYVP